MAAKKTDRISAEMVDMAALLNKHEMLSARDLSRIKVLSSPPPTYTPERVTQIRIKKTKMSQPVFAGFLNVTTSTVQKWESPVSGKQTAGAPAKLLQIIEKNGIVAPAVRTLTNMSRQRLMRSGPASMGETGFGCFCHFAGSIGTSSALAVLIGKSRSGARVRKIGS